MVFIREDADNIEDLIESGSIGLGITGLANEPTASLGLTTPITKLSSSLNEVLNEDDIYSPLQQAFQFVTAKMYQTRDNQARSAWSGSQAHTISTANKSRILSHTDDITTLTSASSSFASKIKKNSNDFAGLAIQNKTSGNITFALNKGSLIISVETTDATTKYTLRQDG